MHKKMTGSGSLLGNQSPGMGGSGPGYPPPGPADLELASTRGGGGRLPDQFHENTDQLASCSYGDLCVDPGLFVRAKDAIS